MNNIVINALFPCITVMSKLLLSSSMDAMLEATRVYGNLSLHKDVRDLVVQNKGIHPIKVQINNYGLI